MELHSIHWFESLGLNTVGFLQFHTNSSSPASSREVLEHQTGLNQTVKISKSIHLQGLYASQLVHIKDVSFAILFH